MSATHDIGDTVRLTFTVKDAAGVLTNSAPVTATLTDPDGTVTTPTVTNTSTGVYTASVVPAKAGLWLYRWTAAGAVVTAEDGQFVVLANATATVYTTVAEVREHLGDTAAKLEQGLLERAVRSASRAVDRYCGRRFWRDTTATARVYRVDDPRVVWVDDFSTTTGLVVASGTDGATYPTVWAAADYQPEPLNAAADGGAYAWWRLAAVGSTSWSRHTHRTTLQVTARWGWSAIPDDVAQAAMIKAAALFRRKDAPFGVAGFGEFGAVRIRRGDPDVAELLDPYVRQLVA